MSTTSSHASLKTSHITIRVSQKHCHLLETEYNNAPRNFQRVIKDFGLEFIEDLPLGVCASTGEFYVEQSIFDEASQRIKSVIDSLRIKTATDAQLLTFECHVHIRITQNDCYLSKSEYNSLSKSIQKLIDNQHYTIIDDIPVDICYYWWDYSDDEQNPQINEESEREKTLRNFTKDVDTLSGAWLLNQERFLHNIPAGEDAPHPLIHIPDDFVFSEADYDEIVAFLPRYAFIMDDSIWNFLLLQGEGLVDRFKIIIKHIRSILGDNFYYLGIAREYAHLKARIVREAFILNQGGISNHGAHISPFLFHSEGKMKAMIDDLHDRIDAIRDHKWRFLLLDDKYSVSLQSSRSDVQINKEIILKKRLNSVLGVADTDTDIYTLDCVATVDDAESRIADKRYDIIFIDYLLENDYGYKLLKRIKDKCDCIEGYQEYPKFVGPFRRLFFMFTSAFTTAVSERLVLEGMNRSKDYWYIGEGACPTNTPQLFDYYLINILDKRLQDTGISDLSPENVYNLMYEIFKPKVGAEKFSVRKRANDHYRKILSLQYHYHRLLDDVNPNNGSELATNFVKSHTHLGGLLEHLLQLVHITAFGSVRQWPEMWEEYLYCKAQFDDYYLIERNQDNLEKIKKSFHEEEEKWYEARLQSSSSKAGCDTSSQIREAKKTKLDTLYRHIEQHILSLKSL